MVVKVMTESLVTCFITSIWVLAFRVERERLQKFRAILMEYDSREIERLEAKVPGAIPEYLCIRKWRKRICSLKSSIPL